MTLESRGKAAGGFCKNVYYVDTFVQIKRMSNKCYQLKVRGLSLGLKVFFQCSPNQVE